MKTQALSIRRVGIKKGGIFLKRGGIVKGGIPTFARRENAGM
jgi:hypothetical protein